MFEWTLDLMVFKVPSYEVIHCAGLVLVHVPDDFVFELSQILFLLFHC